MSKKKSIKPKKQLKKHPSTYSAPTQPQDQPGFDPREKKPKAIKELIPTMNFMVTMALERRQRLEAVAIKLGVSMRSLIEEGVDLIIEKKKAAAEKAFLKG